MSSYAPPTANLPFFNPAVFETEDIALTLSDANKLYAKKSGAIFSGAISAPSLSLNGVNVENKLLEIDANSNKLTDISYNNNVTYILNDLSINGILKLPNLPNAGTTILENKQKTTKISYDAGTSVTTVADTLKSSGTLIVGSQNYNASDEFQKLTNISKSGSILTVNDSIVMTGYLQLPNHSDVNNKLNYFDELLVDVEYDEINNITKIIRDFEVSGNFKLNTITDVEQKILDVSNAITPYISYDSVNDKIVVEKDVDLGTNDLTCNFMRPLAGGNYGLSKNWTQSYLLFRNGGHHIDSFNTADDTGRDLYLNYYAQSGVFIGSHFNNSTTTINGNLKIIETTGTSPIATGGSLTLIHGDTNGSSSIVFKSDNNVNNDYGYISYQDDIDNAGGQKSLLEIGVKNDSVTSTIDNIAIMPSGYVGINTRTPQTMLDVNGDTKISGNLELGTITNVEQKIIDISNNASGGVPSITYDALTETTTFDGSFIYIPTDLSFQLGPFIPNLYSYILSLNSRTSWFENTSQGLQINNNTIIEENLGSRTSQLSIRPTDDVQNAIQEIYSKNGIATLKLGDDNAGTLTYNNILKSENGNATFYGNNSGETKFMEYNSTDDKINISKDMDLSLNNLNCKFMRPYLNGSKYWLSQNHNSSVFEFRNGGHHIDAFNPGSAGAGRDMYINYYAQAGVILGSNLNNSTTKVNGNLIIDEITGTAHDSNGGSLTLIHQDIGGESSIVFKSKKDAADFGYISYEDDISGNSGNERSLLEIGVKNDAGEVLGDSIALMPSRFVGINTRTPETDLDVNGDVRMHAVDCSAITVNGNINCNEIQVNSLPLNSFTSFTIGTEYTPSDAWGQGQIIKGETSPLPTSSNTYTHNSQFYYTSSKYGCNLISLGTYEIYADVIYRNNGGSRHNPVIGIDIDDDISGTSPNWSYTPNQETPFSLQYVRMGEGKVTSLQAKRTHHFTVTTERVSIRTFLEVGGGTDFIDTATSYEIMVATIKFKYIGNFNSITTE